MDPVIWSKVPYDLLECIAFFCDIDSRRALEFKPRKLSKLELNIRIYPIAWRQLRGIKVFNISGPTKILSTGKFITDDGEVDYWHNYKRLSG